LPEATQGLIPARHPLKRVVRLGARGLLSVTNVRRGQGPSTVSDGRRAMIRYADSASAACAAARRAIGTRNGEQLT